jgi:hypothetical protein
MIPLNRKMKIKPIFHGLLRTNQSKFGRRWTPAIPKENAKRRMAASREWKRPRGMTASTKESPTKTNDVLCSPLPPQPQHHPFIDVRVGRNRTPKTHVPDPVTLAAAVALYNIENVLNISAHNFNRQNNNIIRKLPSQNTIPIFTFFSEKPTHKTRTHQT